MVVFFGSLAFLGYTMVLYGEQNERLIDRIDALELSQERDTAFITQSFRELQQGLQIENTELESLLQKQEQQFISQIQNIERQKTISDQLLSRDNQELAQNIGQHSEKLVELESISKPALIAKWSDITVKLNCRYESGARTFGSALYVGPAFDINFGAGNDHVILSNSHVLEEGIEDPTSCTFRWNDGSELKITIEDGMIQYFQDLDAAYLAIDFTDVPQYISSSQVAFQTCNINPTSGDEMLILGYPRIGSSQGITSTEGIVSGYDSPYYITSAKISRGNSGGLAVLVSQDCYVGIPTLVRADEVESLGRILDINSLFQ